ncbi:hypothetical protein BP6252_01782 [Coleophoma cylindrospora]|uniref:Uncharacterized protein n=1 Tax=Coleophoma cylindrospora TaxID=1849047 RepID=A0A3D8STV1_9HELO|nr:hypothetical protein BP6252_01782 [Coleophoma cylindrospora]
MSRPLGAHIDPRAARAQLLFPHLTADSLATKAGQRLAREQSKASAAEGLLQAPRVAAPDVLGRRRLLT